MCVFVEVEGLCHEEIFSLWFVCLLACLDYYSCTATRGSRVGFVLFSITITACHFNYKAKILDLHQSYIHFPTETLQEMPGEILLKQMSLKSHISE